MDIGFGFVLLPGSETNGGENHLALAAVQCSLTKWCNFIEKQLKSTVKHSLGDNCQLNYF